MTNALHPIPGIRIGHWQDDDRRTGCTVVLADRPLLAAVDVRGGAPGTRETDLLAAGRLVRHVDAILLTGGSAFGLAAASGVVRALREDGRGFSTRSIPVPIVPAAVIFDLRSPEPVWPDEHAGYLATRRAEPDGWIAGRVGAGTGATVGKCAGIDRSSPGGLGVAQVTSPAGRVAALMVVNAYGNVVDPDSGAILAGARADDALSGWLDCDEHVLGAPPAQSPDSLNTTIGVVVVDAAIDHNALMQIAASAQAGLARAIRPAHTPVDGDTIFVLSTDEGEPARGATLQLSVAVQRAVSRAIVTSVST